MARSRSVQENLLRAQIESARQADSSLNVLLERLEEARDFVASCADRYVSTDDVAVMVDRLNEVLPVQDEEIPVPVAESVDFSVEV